MKFWEAMKALEEGKRVRPHEWHNSCYDKDTISSYFEDRTARHFDDLLSSQWELYEQPKKTLSFAEVVKGLKQGRRFTRPEWGSAYLRNGPMYVMILSVHSAHGEFGMAWQPTIEDFEATDWVEVKE